MSKQLSSASIAAPGFFGLNTQESSVTLAAGFALQADNCVIDKYGRLGARKGWTYVAEQTGVDLKGSYRFVDIDGTEYFGVWSDTSFYIFNGSSLTPVTYLGSQTITDGNWQFITLNDHAYGFQAGYEPIYFKPDANGIEDMSDSPSASGTPPQANVCSSAYGRVWAANTATNKTTLYWSNLLDGASWNSGDAGSLDISSILVAGNDEITAIGAQNGRLILFCTDNIIIFDDPSSSTSFDPSNMQMVEVIKGVGCIARDSVQNTGTDILFLSQTGLQSLGRVIQEKSQPMRDISKNVRDDIVGAISASTNAEIKSVYSAEEAFYLLHFPAIRRIYCFDMRQPLQDGSARVTIWDNQDHTSMMANGEVYFTNIDGLAKYTGYTDNGQAYRLKYYTNYFDFGNATQVKVLKRLSVTVIGGSNQDFVLKAGFDYTDSYQSYAAKLSAKTVSEYGEDEYNIAEYESGTLVETQRAAAGGAGEVLQVGFEATVNGSELSIQKMDIFVKQGRIY
jgi:hypothetical protein